MDDQRDYVEEAANRFHVEQENLAEQVTHLVCIDHMNEALNSDDGEMIRRLIEMFFVNVSVSKGACEICIGSMAWDGTDYYVV
jgi:hypothetical protein